MKRRSLLAPSSFYSRSNSGFTLTELVVVLGIFSTLIAMTTITLLRPLSSAHLESVYQVLLSDINRQREKAMFLESGGDTTASNHGVYFNSDSYVLFRGSSYSAGDPLNQVTSLPSNITISNITLPSSSLVFSKGSGEIVSFSAVANSLSVSAQNTTISQQIVLNRYGTVE